MVDEMNKENRVNKEWIEEQKRKAAMTYFPGYDDGRVRFQELNDSELVDFFYKKTQVCFEDIIRYSFLVLIGFLFFVLSKFSFIVWVTGIIVFSSIAGSFFPSSKTDNAIVKELKMRGLWEE